MSCGVDVVNEGLVRRKNKKGRKGRREDGKGCLGLHVSKRGSLSPSLELSVTLKSSLSLESSKRVSTHKVITYQVPSVPQVSRYVALMGTWLSLDRRQRCLVILCCIRPRVRWDHHAIEETLRI